MEGNLSKSCDDAIIIINIKEAHPEGGHSIN